MLVYKFCLLITRINTAVCKLLGWELITYLVPRDSVLKLEEQMEKWAEEHRVIPELNLPRVVSNHVGPVQKEDLE